jgi:kinetochore protein Nuf2
VDDLRKPNPQHIQKMFEYFAYILMNITRDVVAPAMKAAADEIVGPESDRLFSADTRDLMGLFVMLRRLLSEVRNLSANVSTHLLTPKFCSAQSTT